MNDMPAQTGESRDEQGRFVPGFSGNPQGRPKGSVSIVGEIKRKLQEVPEGQQKTYLELLVNRILKAAIQDGNDQQIKNILQYVEGMPKQPIRHEMDAETLAMWLRGNEPTAVHTEDATESDLVS